MLDFSFYKCENVFILFFCRLLTFYDLTCDLFLHGQGRKFFLKKDNWFEIFLYLNFV